MVKTIGYTSHLYGDERCQEREKKESIISLIEIILAQKRSSLQV